MEREVEVELTRLEAAMMSHSCQFWMKSARVQRCAEVQTFATCGHVWVRVTQPSNTVGFIGIKRAFESGRTVQHAQSLVGAMMKFQSGAFHGFTP